MKRLLHPNCKCIIEWDQAMACELRECDLSSYLAADMATILCSLLDNDKLPDGYLKIVN